MQTLYKDTITAIATPPGIGGISIIRISGQKAIAIIKKLFSNKAQLKPRFLSYGFILDPKTKEKIDEVCVLYFKAPHSFTGEDVVEIQCHAGNAIIKQLLGLIIQTGARIATAGEFSKRAFLNGKIDLTRAESIIDLIEADSETARKVALNHLEGGLYKKIQTIRKELISLLEHIEASIDFPDEITDLDKQEFQKTVQNCHVFVTKVIDLQDYGKLIQTGVKCLIIGFPNTGKSSLLNQLLGEERAIVTSIPGTTRDYIEAKIEIGGLSFEFIDTAGIRKTTEKIENIGINKISALLKYANAVLWVVDVTRSLKPEEIEISKTLKAIKNKYLLINKTDLKIKKLKPDQTIFKGFEQINISAKKDIGIDTLKQKLYQDFAQKSADLDKDLICNIRQINCLKSVKQSLLHLITHLNQNYEYDILSIDLKEAISKLGEITGDEITEEVLDGIFSRFCVGK